MLARKNNKRLGVTGMLLYHDASFLQVIEGDVFLATKVGFIRDRADPGKRVVSGHPDYVRAACDALEVSIELAVEEGDDDAGVAPVVARLRALAGGTEGTSQATLPFDAPAAASAGAADDDEAPAMRVRVTVDPASSLPGVRAFMAVRTARSLGEVTSLEPSEAAMQEDGFGGTVRFVLRSTTPVGEIEEALRAAGEIREVEIAEGLIDAPAAAPDGEGDATASGTSTAAVRARNIRVDLRRLDALVNGVGELVIVRDRMRRLAGGAEPELADAIDQASRLIGELQDEIMQARMAPVWQVFDRFPRLVRDAARSLGKRVDFVIEGKEIELDRSMLDEIGDPLVHLLRNSLDHGIESPAERRAAGKPEAATLTLSAASVGDIVSLAVPPFSAMNPRSDDLARWLRILPRQAAFSWYTLFNQLPALPERSFDRLVAHLWRRWSPGYDATEDLAYVLDYGTGEAKTNYGVIGVKVWVYKGEVIPKGETALLPGAVGTAMTLNPDTFARLCPDIENPTAQPGYKPVQMPMPKPEQASYNANSLWRNGSRAFFKDQRANQIGDIGALLNPAGGLPSVAAPAPGSGSIAEVRSFPTSDHGVEHPSGLAWSDAASRPHFAVPGAERHQAGCGARGPES